MTSRFTFSGPEAPSTPSLAERLRAKSQRNFLTPQAEPRRTLAGMNSAILAEQRTIIRNIALDCLQADPQADSTSAAGRTLAALDDWISAIRDADRAREPNRTKPSPTTPNPATARPGAATGQS